MMKEQGMMPSAENVPERDEKIEQLVEGMTKKRDREEVKIEKILKDLEVRCSLPEGAVEIISNRVKELREMEVNEGALRKTSRWFVLDALANYYDDRIGIANFNFLKAELLELVDDNLIESREGSFEDLSKSAMIFFDVDGLKSVNDHALGKHDAGDLFLKKIADVFNGGKTAMWLRESGIKFYPARRSGDEFMCAIKASKSLNEKSDFVGIDGENVKDRTFIEYVIEKIQEDVGSLDMDDVQDFSNDEQKAAYDKIGFDTDSWPRDFRFKASISGGVAILKDALRDVLDGENIEGKGYEELLVNVIEKMISISDKEMSVNKEKDQERRAESEDEKERLTESIYRSGRSDQEKIDSLTEENENLKKEDKKKKEIIARQEAELEELRRKLAEK
ncbi:MAG: hypothetical protein OEV93_00150 [Candidatus Moranbacteria bacterium]|nr:hypothetical protein [Candidatus Moranbacteria bacterium]